MRRISAIAGLVLTALAPAPLAADDDRCEVPPFLAEPFASLSPLALAAKDERRIRALIVSGSPSQTGAMGKLRTYPSYLEEALRARLPGVAIEIVVRAAARRTVSDLLPRLPALLSEVRPALVIWQAGTAEALGGVEPDVFAHALEEGAAAVLRSGVSLVFVDMQYSPRTDSLLDATRYVAGVRRVAESVGVPVFSRYGIMRYWNDSGAFDLAALRSDGLFENVHGCLGRLLAAFIVRGAGLDDPDLAGP